MSSLPPDPAPDPRIDRLCSAAATLQCEVAEPALARLLCYLDAMLERNQQINLTAIRLPETAEALHVLDSLAIGALGLSPSHALDLGSGNGFPGVAVAALFPECQVDLMERTSRKAVALRALTRQADFGDIGIWPVDADQAPAVAPEVRGAYDLVTARAVASPEKVARLALPLLAPRGQLVLWLDRATEAPTHLGAKLQRQRVYSYELPGESARVRRLAVYLHLPRALRAL